MQNCSPRYPLCIQMDCNMNFFSFKVKAYEVKARVESTQNKWVVPHQLKIILGKNICTSRASMNFFHKNREISILVLKKKRARLTLPQEAIEKTKQGKTEQTKNTHQYEQKWQSHTCSGTNSSMYDSDLTTTTSPQTSSAPYSG